MKLWHKIALTGAAAMALGGTLIDTSLSIPAVSQVDLVSEQTNILKATGKYEQVIDGKGLDGKAVQFSGYPADASVDTLESPAGTGYVVRWTDGTGYHARGFGVQSQQNTYDIALPSPIASSTP